MDMPNRCSGVSRRENQFGDGIGTNGREPATLSTCKPEISLVPKEHNAKWWWSRVNYRDVA
jgi:hypothetical protein